MNLEQVFQNNQAWIGEKISNDPEYFTNLAKGQTPEILYIGCSDSRVTVESLMGLQPGEIFVHRNVANLVVNTDINSASVITYAITALKVNHVVVCGHYYCGGVKAAMGSDDLGILNPWLKEIRDVYRLHQDELDGIADENDRYKRLVELNVQEQCINIAKMEVFQRASERGITLHGWVFDIGTGKLIDLNIDLDGILSKIAPIYKVD